ncbi:MAG: DNA repair REX1-B-domain-containing protein [Monoraphidium minutum]|nr:MAG: DNA repair REX1-B-domain-containing protein [Monoraphidium minutum]
MAAAPDAGAGPLPLLQQFLAAQERRAALYGEFRGAFRRFLRDRREAPYRLSIQGVTQQFAEVSRQVRNIEARLAAPRGAGGGGRPDLAALLRRVQNAEADKLRLTVSWQALRDAATPQAVAAAGGGREGPAEDDPAAAAAAAAAALAQQVQGMAVEAAAGAGGEHCPAHGAHHAHACANGNAPHANGGAGARPRRAGDQDAPASGGGGGGSGGHGHGHGHGEGHYSGSAAAAAAADGGVLYGADGVAAPLAADVAAAAAEAAAGLDAAIADINAALEEVREAAEELREGLPEAAVA